MLLLYYTESSPPCRIVIVVAKLLDIPLDLILVNTKDGDTKTKEFLSINPQHCVPTLVDDGYVLWESRVISKYLAWKYGRTDSLYPKEFLRQLQVDKMLHFDLGILFRRISDYICPVFTTGKFGADKKTLLDDALGVLNETLKRNARGWVADENLTIADVSILCNVNLLKHVGYDLKDYGDIQKWFQKMADVIPDYDKVVDKGGIAFNEKISLFLKK